LTSTKMSNVYWPIIASPFMLSFYKFQKKIKPIFLCLIYLCFNITLISTSYLITKSPTSININNSFNRLFFGALSFSDEPDKRLSELNLSDLKDCIGVIPYSALGNICVDRYSNRISIFHVPRVLFKEPLIVFHLFKYSCDKMQIISLNYLGKFSINDPNKDNLTRFSVLNIWSTIKAKYFPRSVWLMVTLIMYVSFFGLHIIKNHLPNLAKIGFLTSIATITDMLIAILGDGKADIIKHLFLSNILFDISTIIFISLLVIILYKTLSLLSRRCARSLLVA
jgi:hypothetical protein